MVEFIEFSNNLKKFLEQYEKETMLRVEEDLENDIVKIFGEKITALARAKNGLLDVTELALTTAEHHPYWNILYHSTEIANLVLEKWKDKITQYDIAEIKWAIKELTRSLEKIENNNS